VRHDLVGAIWVNGELELPAIYPSATEYPIGTWGYFFDMEYPWRTVEVTTLAFSNKHWDFRKAEEAPTAFRAQILLLGY
jgi:hypothetical protein